MNISESVLLASGFRGVEYLIITKNGERIASPGWHALEVRGKEIIKNKTPTTTKEKISSGWSNDFELVINLEINLQKQGFVKRPYVAIWVEDENHVPLRTISVWHGSDDICRSLNHGILNTEIFIIPIEILIAL